MKAGVHGRCVRDRLRVTADRRTVPHAACPSLSDGPKCTFKLCVCARHGVHVLRARASVTVLSCHRCMPLYGPGSHGCFKVARASARASRKTSRFHVCKSDSLSAAGDHAVSSSCRTRLTRSGYPSKTHVVRVGPRRSQERSLSRSPGCARDTAYARPGPPRGPRPPFNRAGLGPRR